ncbi:hypothetical protein CG007_01610 [Mesoplasma entomophilum]|uniref:hypothetical protein n=1 Tax=Mesoplasma entomophilum TaxID=2149 RepID=UPI000D040D45|nr:hypothetical protein [Mesoplasma entomophilum]AVN60312.1 hypothetical protein CG007_01610 [Mesoplasma entomophilum]
MITEIAIGSLILAIILVVIFPLYHWIVIFIYKLIKINKEKNLKKINLKSSEIINDNLLNLYEYFLVNEKISINTNFYNKAKRLRKLYFFSSLFFFFLFLIFSFINHLLINKNNTENNYINIIIFVLKNMSISLFLFVWTWTIKNDFKNEKMLIISNENLLEKINFLCDQLKIKHLKSKQELDDYHILKINLLAFVLFKKIHRESKIRLKRQNAEKYKNQIVLNNKKIVNKIEEIFNENDPEEMKTKIFEMIND